MTNLKQQQSPDQAMLAEVEGQRRVLAEVLSGTLGTRAGRLAGLVQLRTNERDAVAVKLDEANKRIAELEAKLAEHAPPPSSPDPA